MYRIILWIQKVKIRIFDYLIHFFCFFLIQLWAYFFKLSPKSFLQLHIFSFSLNWPLGLSSGWVGGLPHFTFFKPWPSLSMESFCFVVFHRLYSTWVGSLPAIVDANILGSHLQISHFLNFFLVQSFFNALWCPKQTFILLPTSFI